MESEQKPDHDAPTVLIVGFGSRGSGYALYDKRKMRLVAVADPNPKARKKAQRTHNILPGGIFDDWRQVIALETKIADGVIISTPDHMHAEQAIAFAKRGYAILLEKPMATTPEDCERIVEACDAAGVVLMVCHVLRYLPANKLMRKLVEDGAIGELMHVTHTEPVGYFHFPHSYVRGKWAVEEESGPTALTKCSHDFDLVKHYVGSKCTRVASMGSLSHFTKEKKPEAGAERCLDCPLQDTCQFSAKKIYLNPVAAGKLGWPAKTLVQGIEPDIENITEALCTTDYGKCVYTSRNNVVDRQTTIFEFENKVVASLNMVAATRKICDRRTELYGSDGQIICEDGKTVHYDQFSTNTQQILTGEEPPADSKLQNHTGADYFLMRAWIDAVSERIAGAPITELTNGHDSLESHLLVFEAERARHRGSVVDFTAEKSLRSAVYGWLEFIGEVVVVVLIVLFAAVCARLVVLGISVPRVSAPGEL